jgi:hypothetical protein
MAKANVFNIQGVDNKSTNKKNKEFSEGSNIN